MSKTLSLLEYEQKIRNVQKMAELRRARTHCKRGHPLSGDNVRIQVRRNSTSRICRTCQRDQTYFRKVRDQIERERLFRKCFPNQTLI